MVNPNSKSAAVPNKNLVEPAKADPKPTDAKPVEPVKSEPTTAPAAAPAVTDGGKSGEKTIISLSVPEKLARQVRLLAKLEGKTISALFLDAVAAEIPARLKVALASITEE